MTNGSIPEYHLLFETGSGDVTLEVRLADRDRAKICSFPSKQISWAEVLKLFRPDGTPIEQMSFDEWLFNLRKVEIEPGKRRVTLVIQ
ncbi:MAG: hypothetical protein ABSD38_35200 [Syntrophorhabdales bacterium]|jgi:hypothetical protein